MNQTILCLTCNKENIRFLAENWSQIVGKVLLGIAIATLESRLGFSIEPWFESIGRMWAQNTVRVANRFFTSLFN